MTFRSRVWVGDLLRCRKAGVGTDIRQLAGLFGLGVADAEEPADKAPPAEPDRGTHKLPPALPEIPPREVEHVELSMPLRAESLRPEEQVAEVREVLAGEFERVTEADFTSEPSKRVLKSPPLTVWSRLWPFLHRTLGGARPGRAVDVARLVREFSRLRPVRRIPRLPTHRWPLRLDVVLDRRQALAPFWSDMEALLWPLRHLHGREGFAEHVLDDGDLPCDLPLGGDAVLVVGDLGLYAGEDSPLVSRWLRLGRQLARQGIPHVALLPCPRSRWLLATSQAWICACWDRGPQLPHGGRGQLPLPPDGEAAGERWRNLARLLASAQRVEPQLLRWLRLQLPPDLADVGTEYDLWHDPERCVHTHTAMAILPEEAKRLRAAGLACLSSDQLVGVRNAYAKIHAYCSPMLRARETANLARSGVPIDPGALAKARDLLVSANRTLASWAGMAKENEGDPAMALEEAEDTGLALTVRRDVARLSEEEKGQEPELGRAWEVLSVLERHTRARMERPTDLSDDPAVRDALLVPGARVLWEVRQYGQELRFAPFVPPREREEPEALAGAPLVWIPETRGYLDVTAADTGGHRRGERLWKKRDAFPSVLLGPARQVEIRSDVAVQSLSVVTRPAWACRFGQDEFGQFAELEVKGIRHTMRWIPPGSFWMGSPEDEEGRYEREGPRHLVTLTEGFWLGTTPVTQELWEVVMEGNPSSFKGERLPVASVTWHDCQEFCELLKRLVPGLLPRFPTEAEWEYACRAGTDTAFNDGSSCESPEGRDEVLAKLGWYDENSDRRTHPVGQLLPNAWGLHDMHGNVWEWCMDGRREYGTEPIENPKGPTEDEAYRVFRGGSSWGLARSCRSAYRRWFVPGSRDRDQGFRFAAGQPAGSGATGRGDEPEGRRSRARTGRNADA